MEEDGGIFFRRAEPGWLLLLRQKKAIRDSGKYFPSNQRVEIK